jgi:acyl phosphate:glycerol-3-phosphate acyltransferase
VVALAHLAGSIPFSNLMARRRAAVDLRQVGTGTVSGSGLYRVAGFEALAVAGVAEVAKGAVGPALAGRDRPVLAAVAAGAGVSGHNWSPFLGGAGGRGISPAVGALLVADWPGAATLLGGLAIGKLAHQTGIGGFVADLLVVPVLAATRGRHGALLGAAVLAPMIAKRLLGNRAPADRSPGTYAARLVFDRDEWVEA